MTPPSRLDLDALRRRLARERGRTLWQSLEALAGTPALQALVERDFPRQAAAVGVGVDRRDFLRLVGASLALAGLGACTRQPAETIVPYVRQPEHLVLGEALHFATAMPLAGVGTGLLVESHEGRPTKIEGNPEHPASLGASDVLAQASLLTLYDPDRSQVITHLGDIRPWSGCLAALEETLGAESARRGAGLRLLTETVTSPTLAHQIRQLLAAFPEARWHQWEPAGRNPARLGARRAFGEFVDTRLRVGEASVVLALDADFLAAGPGAVRHARELTRRRRPDGAAPMNRLYVVEPMPSVTGAIADHRLPLRAGDVEGFARAVAARVGVRLGLAAPAVPEATARFAEAVARDLERHRGASLVVAGEQQPPAVHALAHAMNATLGNVGRTIEYSDPVEAEPVDQDESLRALVDDMAAGRVEVLAILGGNPVHTAPADLRFAAHLRRVAFRLHLGLHSDETAALCHWHVPEAHFLEAWSDVRAFDGTVTIVQPLIAPLYQGRSAHEVLAAFGERPGRSGHDLVRDYWRARHAGGDFDAAWRRALHDGVVAGTRLPARRPTLRPDWDAAPAPPPAAAGLEIVFRPDPHVHDGRFANNGWLQELPRPLTKLTWDNAALLAPATAERLGLRTGDVVELRRPGTAVRAPVFVLPGHAADAVTVHLGYGRTRAGAVAHGVGFDAYPLRTADALHAVRGVEVAPTGERHVFACTQEHHAMEGRDLVRVATLEAWRAHSGGGGEAHAPAGDPNLFPPHQYDGHAWGMAIDLTACLGCNACAIACQAENNVPLVGRDQVARGREMHWLRVDRYWTGDPEAPETLHQPVLCMHCEQAPCEVVCPVNATVHSSEGLNEMVYNRCVGTRYCSNNCPYKVRRFNFYLYSDWATETFRMARNPDVSVRSRGVMEKCTYCVQRIEGARARAITEDRPIRDGDVVPACAQACPAEAIVFGDVNDPTSRVAKLRADPRHYALLGELNTRPRTTYLAAVRNPNPALEPGGTG